MYASSSVALVVALTIAAGCSGKRPATASPRDVVETRVTVDRSDAVRTVQRETIENRWVRTVFPPRYFTEVLPDYPPAAVEARVPRARVRVDFRVGRDGRVHDARAAVVDEVPLAADFERACLGVIDRWRFSPAWRLVRDDTEADDPLILLDYEANLVFRFDLEVHEAGGPVSVGEAD
jgi:hypothetical protein